jgi:hypothetical protein
MVIYALKFLGVIISMFLVDVCWAKYFIYVGKHDPIKSATWGSMIMLFGAFTTINYVGDRTLLIAAIIGSFLGTYVTVLREKNKSQKNEDHKNS